MSTWGGRFSVIRNSSRYRVEKEKNQAPWPLTLCALPSAPSLRDWPCARPCARPWGCRETVSALHRLGPVGMTEKAKPDAEQQGGDPESSLGMRVLPHVGPGPWRWVHKQDLESEWVEGGAVAPAVVGPPPRPRGQRCPAMVGAAASSWGRSRGSSVHWLEPKTLFISQVLGFYILSPSQAQGHKTLTLAEIFPTCQ